MTLKSVHDLKSINSSSHKKMSLVCKKFTDFFKNADLEKCFMNFEKVHKFKGNFVKNINKKVKQNEK